MHHWKPPTIKKFRVGYSYYSPTKCDGSSKYDRRMGFIQPSRKERR